MDVHFVLSLFVLTSRIHRFLWTQQKQVRAATRALQGQGVNISGMLEAAEVVEK